MHRSIGCVLAIASAAAFAHARSGGATPHDLHGFGWDFERWVVVLMGVGIAAYAAGFVRLWRRGSTRRGRRVRAGHGAAFAAGWLVLAAVLFSPVDTLSDALFSVHMIQHEAMMLIAAPLFVLGRPLGVLIWALPRRARIAVGRLVRTGAFMRGWRALTSPLAAWLLYAAALWVWHAPALFEAALANPAVHSLQHASFLTAALIFWWMACGRDAQRRPGGYTMLALFTTMLHSNALGALITLSPGLWYPSYAEPATALGIDPLRDQQFGGLIMWVPGMAVYLLGALAVAKRWLGRRGAPIGAPSGVGPREDAG